MATSSRSPTRRTRGSPTTATCATSSCASTSRPSTASSSPRARRSSAGRSRPGFAPRSFLMAPRWLDGLADVLATHRRALLRAVRGARRGGHRLPRAPRRAGVARAPAAAVASTTCSTAPGRCWCSRTSSTTPTSARSSAPAPRSASTPCCWRRAAPTRSTGARSRSAWARSSRTPWTRLPDWYDALPVALGAPASPPSRSPWPTTRCRSRRPSPALDRVALVLGSEGHGLSRALGAVRRPPRDHPDGRRHRLAQRRRRHRGRLLRHRPPLSGQTAKLVDQLEAVLLVPLLAVVDERVLRISASDASLSGEMVARSVRTVGSSWARMIASSSAARA